MPWFQETTEWGVSAAPNHTYLMNDGRNRIMAYVKVGETEPKVFAKAIMINSRGRKFVLVKDRWNIKLEEDSAQGRSWRVVGSTGSIYTVRQQQGSWSCDCSGYQFRGRCRHVAEKQAAPA